MKSFFQRPGHVLVKVQRFAPGQPDQTVEPPVTYNPLGVSVAGLFLFLLAGFMTIAVVIFAALAAGVR